MNFSDAVFSSRNIIVPSAKFFIIPIFSFFKTLEFFWFLCHNKHVKDLSGLYVMGHCIIPTLCKSGVLIKALTLCHASAASLCQWKTKSSGGTPTCRETGVRADSDGNLDIFLTFFLFSAL